MSGHSTGFPKSGSVSTGLTGKDLAMRNDHCARISHVPSYFPFVIALLGLVMSVASPEVVCADEESPISLETTITVNLEDFEAIPHGMYQHIRMRGATEDNMLRHVGDPQLPVFIKWFLLPPDRTATDLEVVVQRRVEIPGEFHPFPIMPEDEDWQSPPDNPPWEDEVYPASAGIIVMVDQARAYRLAKVIIYPLEYDALLGRLTLLQSMRIRLALRALTSEEERNSIRIKRPEAVDDVFGFYRSWVERIVENPDDLDRFYPRFQGYGDDIDGERKVNPLVERTPSASFISEWPSTEGLTVDYLIITNNRDENGNEIGNMDCIFGQWKDALEADGLTVITASVDGIDNQPNYAGFDRCDRIRNFIRHALVDWGISFVLLAGDESVVPTRRLGGPNSEVIWGRPDPPADHWYTRLGRADDPWIEYWNADGDAWIAEGPTDSEWLSYHGLSSITLARLPARNAEEASHIVSKLIHYHRHPLEGLDRAWYSTALGAAGPTNSAKVDEPDYNGIIASESILEPLDAEAWDLHRLYPFVGVTVEGVCPNHEDTCYVALHNEIKDKEGLQYWEGTDLFDTLTDPGACSHIVYFMEHSMRDRWGAPKGDCERCDPDRGDCPDETWNASACQDELEKSISDSNIEHLDYSQVLALGNAVNDPKYSFILSSGSWTNMMDMDAIGEAFLRAPGGGAVLYVGKTSTRWPPRRDIFKRVIESNLVENVQQSFCFGVQSAIHELSMSGLHDIKWGCDLPVLGDPYICAWTSEAAKLDVAVTPNPIPKLGIQTVRVTIRNSETWEPVEGALVRIRQGDLMYARTRTDSYGRGVAKGLAVQDSGDSVYVTAARPGLMSTTVSVPVSAFEPYVAYSSHDVNDSSGGDGDGILEAGESASIAVTLRNLGTAASQKGFAALRPSPSVVLDLKINGTFRSEDTRIGKESARPEAEADTFRVPMTQQGVRVEGEPFSISPIRRETFKVWRDEQSGRYNVGTHSYSASPDSVFTGILRGRADFSEVSMSGESGDEYFWDGDSIWFQFHGDATEDRISFKAEAPNWLTIDTTAVVLPSLQPGDSTTVSFPITLLSEIPDRADLILTVTAYQGLMTTTFFHSDFVEQMARPHVELVSVDMRFGDFGCQDTSWQWTPVIRNRGSAEADSVRLILCKTAGTPIVSDSVVTFSRIEADSIAIDGEFLICMSSTSDTADFEATIRQETFHKQLWDIALYDGGGGGAWSNPDNLEADLMDGTVVLRWDPIELDAVTGYKIEYANVPDPEPHELTWVDRIGAAASRYEVRIDLQAPGDDGTGYDCPYYFFVTGCTDAYCGWASSKVGPVYPWVHERPQYWPRLMSGMSTCAPLVVNLGDYFDGAGYAIFTATDKIYAWNADGAPLNPAASNGLFYDPSMGPPAADRRFVQALAFGDWDPDDTYPQIAGNMASSGIFILEIVPYETGFISGHIEWLDSVSSRETPIVAASTEPAGSNFLFLAGTADSYIYTWDAQALGYPVGDEGRFAIYGDGSENNYQSLAVGYACDPPAPFMPQHDIVAVTRSGSLYCFGTDYIYSGFAPVRWQHCLVPSGGWVSTPAVGDVTGNGENDVVVTNLWQEGEGCQFIVGADTSYTVPGQLWIFDENTGESALLEEETSCEWNFRRGGDDVPPGGVALAQLDDDDGLEIIVAGNVSSKVNVDHYPVEIRLYVFHFEDGQLTYDSTTGSIPYTQRNTELPGHVQGGDEKGVHYPIGTPIVGDIDPDGGHPKPDIFVTSSQGAVFAFEYDYQGASPEDRLYPKKGWPLLLPDHVREPTLAKLDSNTEQFSLVVQCQDGWVHVFDLPRTGEALSGPAWGSYGADLGNTRGRLSCVQGKARPDGPEVDEQVSGVIIKRVRPLSDHASQEILLLSDSPRDVSLDVYDVVGRRIQSIYHGRITRGETVVRWNGRQRNGALAPSGIYRYHLQSGSQVHVRRAVLLH